ncbi:phenylalanine--tRNA ligase beta subunit-related protein [uncultured Devosia sp.]|uniref:B3/B4 domain-containing protein n=1 Tax=uncultured Devosia sp. TaxID=211434 RepID=UPI002638C2A8|nr:phenylalanine--tRNA ligase beta subunit-related protein [uncultured Devosia sp.]
MSHITIEVSESARQIVPNLRVFGVVVRDLDGLRNADITVVLEAATKSLAEAGFDPELLAQSEPFRSWRNVFAAMGLQPSRFRSSVEALVRRTLKTGMVPVTGIKAVDLYNAGSVWHQVPMGAYDLDRVSGPIMIRTAQPTDAFVPLGGAPEDFPLKETVVVYAQDSQVLCFGVNHRDNLETAITQETNDAVFFAESLADVDPLAAPRALEWLASLLFQMGGSRGAVFAVPVNGEPVPTTSWDEMV